MSKQIMKNNTTTLLLSAIMLFSCVSAAHAEQSFWSWLFSVKRMKEVAPMTDPVYNEECGACHLAYQAGLLPERSWRKLLDAKALEDHFGENAELDEETRKHILDVLVANSADKSWYKRSRKIMSSLDKDQTPLRITQVPYIKEKHEEVMEEVVKTSKKVKSLSFCDKCHQQAEQGRYDDDTVVIPGYGTWTW
jgi:hypothetical protein